MKSYPEELEKGQVSPLDVVASQGKIALYKYIAEKIRVIKESSHLIIVLHYTAGIERCQCREYKY